MRNIPILNNISSSDTTEQSYSIIKNDDKINYKIFIIEFFNNIFLNILIFYINYIFNSIKINEQNNIGQLLKTNIDMLIFVSYSIIKYILLNTYVDNINIIHNECLLSIVYIIIFKKKIIYYFLFIFINFTSTIISLYIISLIFNKDIETYYFFKYNTDNTDNINNYNTNINKYFNIAIGSLLYYIILIKKIYYNNTYETSNKNAFLLSFIYGLFYFIFNFNGFNSLIISLYFYYKDITYYIYLIIIIINSYIAFLINKYIINEY